MGKINRWGIDIFRLSDVTRGRPLTAVAYTILQVIFNVAFIRFYWARCTRSVQLITDHLAKNVASWVVFGSSRCGLWTER